jgi:hypothetical protein
MRDDVINSTVAQTKGKQDFNVSISIAPLAWPLAARASYDLSITRS